VKKEMGGWRASGPWQGDIPGTRAVLTALLIITLFLVIPPVSATVYMYNATGGGTVQSLINSTANGDSIFLPAGTYYENLIIDRAIVFGALDTKNPPVIVTTGPGAGIVLAADGITLNGLNIYGNAKTGLAVQSNNNRITDLTLRGMGRGIELKNAADNIFSGNTVTNNSVGITLDRSSRSNTFFFNQFANTVDVAGQSANTLWSSTRQDYTYNGSSYSGPLGNYWKAYTGTDSDGNGVGDSAFSVMDATTAISGTSEITDRAPLVSLPGSYTLLVKNTSLLNATGINGFANPPSDLSGLQQQPSDQPASKVPGDQAPYTGNLPSSGPGTTSTPPPGAIPMILVQFWWVILIVVLISVIVGVWFERSRRKAPHPVQVEYVQVNPAANATVVKRPGTTGPAAGDWKDQQYYTAHLPPGLEKKYPDAEYMGEGGVGRVFRAWDAGERRHVAVKIPIRFDEVTGTQFTKELHIWQGLHHKNIVEMYAANIFPMPYIEMEYVESSLANLKFPIGTDRAVKIITGVAEGLRYAHERDIVHRDIKPENILITSDDTPKITDWGLAKALTDTKQTGLISFSLNYAAPEQLAPNIYGEAGKSTDIYQLGVLFYEMVTGRLPFSGAGMGEITQAILHNTPLPPALAGRNADAIRSIIAKCLQKKPQDRYASVAGILEDLQRLDHEK
jgi:eukaryotic-like serine/threonine-protein kinase